MRISKALTTMVLLSSSLIIVSPSAVASTYTCPTTYQGQTFTMAFGYLSRDYPRWGAYCQYSHGATYNAFPNGYTFNANGAFWQFRQTPYSQWWLCGLETGGTAETCKFAIHD